MGTGRLRGHKFPHADFILAEPSLSSSSSLPLPTPRPRPPWFPMDQVGGPNTWTTLNNHLNGIQNATDAEAPPEREGGGSRPGGLSSSAQDGEEVPKVIKVPVPKPFDFPAQPRTRNPHLPIEIPRQTTTSRSRGPTAGPTEPTPTVRPFRQPPPPENGYEDDDLHVVVNFTQFCPPSTARGLFWNWTRAGETAVLQCPSGSTGFAKWRCGADSRWAAQAPTFAECRSELFNIAKIMIQIKIKICQRHCQ